ncbi:MAG: TIR domain-containing protein [Gammaproteobacteria bacterium]
MTENNPIRLFVTHLYAPDEAYFRVFEYLESQPNFFYSNLATPEKPPRSKEKEAIREDLRRQMAEAEVVMLLSSLYARDPVLIEYQGLYAQSCNKPLIVMEPFGTTDAVPAKLREMADEVVPWNGREMADAIRRQARHEDTTRWDTIEFKLD